MSNYPFLDWARLQTVLKSQLGKPYKFGVEVGLADPSPQAFDCSEFVEWGYAQIGLTVPDGSENQYEASVPVRIPQVGDVGFFIRAGSTSTHHVGVLLDADTVIEARGVEPSFEAAHIPDNQVILRPRFHWEAWSEFTGWRRFKAVMA